MRICVITYTYPHVGEPWIYEPVESLRARGHEVRVIAARRGELDGMSPSRFPARITNDWLSRREKTRAMLRAPVRAAMHAPRAAALRHHAPFRELLARSVLPEIVRADVVLAHFGDVGATWLPVAAIARRPLAVFFHGYDATALPALKPDFYDALFASGAALLTNGPYLRSRLIAAGAPADRIHIVRLAAPPEVGELPSPELSAPRIITVARLMPKKGLDDAIVAFARAQWALNGAWRYEIIGQGELRDPLGALARDTGVGSLVDFRGVLPHEQALDAMREASIFVLASKVAPSGDTEGTPVAIIEAATLGLPVVATRHAGIPDLLPADAEARGFLVPEGDVQALSVAIATLASDERLRREWAARCRAHARGNFSAAAHLDALVGAMRDHARIPVLRAAHRAHDPAPAHIDTVPAAPHG
ncbi:MAG TPA: glycosyltransferase [Gemmatimonadaceae bacterium]